MLTTAQKLALTGVGVGAIVYDITLAKHQGYAASVWNSLY